jgi:hypothetical protein
MFKMSLKLLKYMNIRCYATCFSHIGPSSGNTYFKGVYCTVNLVKYYSLRHVVVVIINFLNSNVVG